MLIPSSLQVAAWDNLEPTELYTMAYSLGLKMERSQGQITN